MKKIILVVVMLIMTALFVTSCSKTDNQEKTQTTEPIYNPLTHEQVSSSQDLERRVFIVSIDNSSTARPQSGISSADIMYEVPAEGGISRYLALFYVGSADTIGPVRSARPYMVDVAREWNAVFVHCGWSEDAKAYLQKGYVDYINEFGYGSSFWRDKSRKAPHNLYTSTENLYAILDKKGWDSVSQVREFPFYSSDDVLVGDKADLVDINYPAAKNRYKYDVESGLYLRYINSEAQIDPSNDKQIEVANVIVQKVSSKVLDSAGRLSINLTGSGEAILFSKGTVRIGTWKRDDLNSPTYFCDDAGDEWQLAPGKTWIQVCNQYVKISYQDTTATTDKE